MSQQGRRPYDGRREGQRIEAASIAVARAVREQNEPKVRPWKKRADEISEYMADAEQAGLHDAVLQNAVEQVQGIRNRLGEVAIKIETAGAKASVMDKVMESCLDLVETAIAVCIGEQLGEEV